jgi:DNA-binding transcriptional regulator YiaG
VIANLLAGRPYEERLSADDLAERTPVKATTVRDLIPEVKTESYSTLRRIVPYMSSKPTYRNKSVLKRLYVVEGLTQTEIAKRFGISQDTVSYWLNKHDIHTREAPPQVRFDRKYEKEDGGCWVWTGSTTENGYGKFWFEGYNMRAHRASYILHVDDFDRDLYMLHKCHNPSCVNPDHLYPGTQKDNMADAIDRGTMTKGEEVGNSKLSKSDVLKIRDLAENSDLTHEEISEKFPIAQAQTTRIINGDRWGWL